MKKDSKLGIKMIQDIIKTMHNALKKIHLHDCTCNKNHPCPAAIAFDAMCTVDDIFSKYKKTKG